MLLVKWQASVNRRNDVALIFLLVNSDSSNDMSDPILDCHLLECCNTHLDDVGVDFVVLTCRLFFFVQGSFDQFVACQCQDGSLMMSALGYLIVQAFHFTMKMLEEQGTLSMASRIMRYHARIQGFFDGGFRRCCLG